MYKLNLGQLTTSPWSRGGGGDRGLGGLQSKYLVPCCCNRDSLRFNMQHGPRVRWVGGVCRQNIYYHVAIFRDSI